MLLTAKHKAFEHLQSWLMILALLRGCYKSFHEISGITQFNAVQALGRTQAVAEDQAMNSFKIDWERD